jgi:plasmid replication initiation protein
MALTPLLPVRHHQDDFFIADIFDNLPFKGDMASMEHPLFTLSKKPDMRILRYEKDDASVEMHPSSYGLPSIMDKDVLLYCASVVMGKINDGEYPPQTIRLSLHDVLIATNRHTNKEGYEIIKRSLHRLTGCMLKTSIKTGRTTQEKGFHLIESFGYLESVRVKDRMIGVELTLSDWFYNSLIAKEVLTINKDYFRLRSPLERRIYEIARKHEKHIKSSGSWAISTKNLYKKTGSASPLKKFTFNIKKLCASNHIPDYLLFLDAKNIVHFRLKNQASEVTDEEAEHQYQLDLDTEITHALSEADIAKAKKAAGRADIYGLWSDFRQYNMAANNQLDSVTAAFIGWCKLKRM